MSGRSAKNSNRGSDLFGYFVSGKYKEFHTNQYAGSTPSVSGLTATGGIISDYTVSSTVYRAHIFTSTGSFDVQGTGDFGNDIDFLVVGGGGGGAFTPGNLNGGRGAGGAGGLRTNAAPAYPHNLPSSTMTYPGSGTVSYTVTVGAGGASGVNAVGQDGNPSSIVHPSLNSGTGIVATGGGYGSHNPGSAAGGGGSGGGGAYTSSNGGPTEASPDGLSPTTQGFAGGPGGSGPDYGGGGGGGATAAGQEGGNAGAHTAGYGGAGLQVAIAGPTATTFTGVGAKNPSNNQYQYFAGGGGAGGGYPEGNGPKGAVGGVGGGGNGADGPHGDNALAQSGESGTGGGGGGGSGYLANSSGNGGSGVVIVRYQIGSVATQKATGGAISFFGGKTIHTFTSSGAFTTNGAFNETVAYLIIGGGGGGGRLDGGGGGAGAFRTADNLSVSVGTATPMAVNVGAGGIGAPNVNPVIKGTNGGPSSVAFPSGTITSDGGGGGGSHSGNETGSPSQSPGNGSGGGAAHHPTSQAGGSGGAYGNNGATGYGGLGVTGSNAGGGGGGAGGSGIGNPSPDANRSQGGAGLQAPATFQDPKSSVGFPGSSGGFWFAGGGGGGSEPSYAPGAYQGAGGGAPVGTSYAGAGIGGKVNAEHMSGPTAAQNAQANSGSGGGGGGYESANGGPGAKGGSGIVLIAYPT